MLLVRKFRGEHIGTGTVPYIYLSPDTYVRREDSRPRNIDCRLAEMIQAKFLKNINKLVVE